jgi:hypothetical protein
LDQPVYGLFCRVFGVLGGDLFHPDELALSLGEKGAADVCAAYVNAD